MTSQVESAPPASRFGGLPLAQSTLDALDEMGWHQPTSVQKATLMPTLEGHDLIVQAPTGTGKTGAFAIPLIDKLLQPRGQVQALVLAPTRELASQSASTFTTLGAPRQLQVAAVYGGTAMDPQVQAFARGVDVISATPGRLLDHLQRGNLNLSQLRLLVLDEADEILSMGFAKEVQAILEHLPTTRQTLLYSATVDDEVQRIASRHMRDPRFLTLCAAEDTAANIAHSYYLIAGSGRSEALADILRVEAPAAAMIFCNTKAETAQVAETLQRRGFDAVWLNSDLSQHEREKIMAGMRDQRMRLLVATDIAARGVDISHVSHVINYNFPAAAEQYIHRTGRTGRAGRSGTAISLVSPQELGALYYLRLQSDITLVEKSLPSQREQQSRRQSDQVLTLATAFAAPATEEDLAIARRVSTHPAAENIVAGLVRGFFSASPKAPEKTAAPSQGAKAPVPSQDRKAPAKARRPKEPASPAMITLELSIGREHGLRASELGRLLRETGAVKRSDLGRIRIREQHSLVSVAADLVEELERRLPSVQFQQQPVKWRRH